MEQLWKVVHHNTHRMLMEYNTARLLIIVSSCLSRLSLSLLCLLVVSFVCVCVWHVIVAWHRRFRSVSRQGFTSFSCLAFWLWNYFIFFYRLLFFSFSYDDDDDDYLEKKTKQKHFATVSLLIVSRSVGRFFLYLFPLFLLWYGNFLNFSVGIFDGGSGSWKNRQKHKIESTRKSECLGTIRVAWHANVIQLFSLCPIRFRSVCVV